MHKYRLSKYLERIIKKLSKKDRILYESLMKKINEIINSNRLEHYKNLQYALKEYKRVHVGSFVLLLLGI